MLSLDINNFFFNVAAAAVASAEKNASLLDFTVMCGDFFTVLYAN